MPVFKCNDGNAEIEITADSPREAAEAYVEGGDWDVTPEGGTLWVQVWVWSAEDEQGGGRSITVEIEPPEPDCIEGEDEHDWHEDSVRGNGGGVVIHETCRRCGRTRVTDTWAQDRSTGEQGLTSVWYPLPADE